MCTQQDGDRTQNDRIKKDFGVVYGEKISMDGKKFRSAVVAALDVK